MVSSRFLAVAVLALRPFLIEALREPRIFYNLTMEEFHTKREAYRKRSLGDRLEAVIDHNTTTEHFAHLSKRVAVRGEESNNADQQAVVELRTQRCATKYGRHFRATRGSCIKSRPKQMNFFCTNAEDFDALRRPDTGAVTHNCLGETKCDTMTVYNFRGNQVQMPYCADVMEINRKEKEVDVAPAYEGQKNVPEIWDKEKQDTFWRIYGEFEKALTGNFDFRGYDASGNTFRAQSPGHVNSRCCMDCPSGTLYGSTIGFKSQAFGFTVPSTLL